MATGRQTPFRRLIRHLAGTPSRPELLRPARGWLLLIPSVYAIAVVGSVLYGTPRQLPGVALGLPALLDLERAASVLAAVAAVLIFALLTSRGELPTQIGSVAYPDRARQQELARQVAELEQQLRRRLVPLEEGKESSDEALPLIANTLKQLNERLDAIEGEATRLN
ncbi:MAG: hypothetical protein ACHQHO_12030 [Solirubrobacterales bacterium]